MATNLSNFADNLELYQIRQLIIQGRNQEVLRRLYKLSAVYLDNQELNEMMATVRGRCIIS